MINSEPIISILFFVAFIYLLFLLYCDYTARNWKTTTGKIRKSKIEQLSCGKYRIYIEYEYNVRKKLYSSHRSHFLSRMISDEKNSADYYTEKYKENNHVPVYYNTLFPALAVVVPGESKKAIYFSIFFITLCYGTLKLFLGK